MRALALHEMPRPEIITDDTLRILGAAGQYAGFCALALLMLQSKDPELLTESNAQYLVRAERHAYRIALALIHLKDMPDLQSRIHGEYLIRAKSEAYTVAQYWTVNPENSARDPVSALLFGKPLRGTHTHNLGVSSGVL